VRARMLAEDRAVAVDDRAGPWPEPGVAREEGALAGAREEAQILGLAPARDLEPRLPGETAHVCLVQLAERKAHASERRGRECREDVALILGLVSRSAQQRALLHAGVVP